MLNEFATFDINNILWDCQYQAQVQYSKNTDFIKEKYKKWIKPLILIEKIPKIAEELYENES